MNTHVEYNPGVRQRHKVGYGWQRDLPDHRDFKFRNRKVEAPMVLPTVVSLRRKMPNYIFDQLSIGSCTANSSCMMWDFVHRTGPYSRLQEYYNTRYVEGTVNQDSGGQIRDAIKCLSACGVAQETLWPYYVGQFTVPPPANVVEAGKQDEVTTYLSIAQDREMMECLAEGFPFVAGFTVYDQFESDTCAQTGIVAMPNDSSNPVGGHAVCVIGYDLDFHTNPVFLNSKIPAQYVSNQMFEVRNSWGVSWGDAGHFWIPVQYLQNANLASDFWTIRK